MPLDERISRWRAAMDVLGANTLNRWLERFLAAVESTPEEAP